MGVIAFHFEPKSPSPDLYRHLLWTRRFINRDPVQLLQFYKDFQHGFIVWDLLILIADKFGNEHFLPAIVVSLNYTFYILSCELCLRNLEVSRNSLSLFFITKFGLVNIYHLFSGLRNSLSFSILTYLLLYIIFSKKISKIKVYILFFVSLFIHMAAIIAVFFIFFLKYYKSLSWLKNLLLFWSIFSFIIVKLLSFINIPWFSYLMQRIEMYYFSWEAIDLRIFLVHIFYIIFVYIKLRIYKSRFNCSDDKYYHLFSLIICFTIGSFCFPTLITRMLYLIGFLSLPMIVKEFNCFSKEENICNVFIQSFIVLSMGAFNINAMFSHIGLSL